MLSRKSLNRIEIESENLGFLPNPCRIVYTVSLRISTIADEKKSRELWTVTILHLSVH